MCGEPGPAPCAACAATFPGPPALPPPPGLDGCVAAVAYRDGGQALVAALKFGGARGALPWVVAELAARLDRQPLRFDVVTWVPTTPAHRRRRGGDQAEVIARSLARRLRLPARSLLRRLSGPAQAGRSAAARRVGPPLELRALPPPRILVVDDVITTGGSVAAAARVLRSAGAATVAAAAVARTPPGRLST